MRSIRGWIINLLDGLAPPPGTVTVRAVPEATNTDISLTQHGLGHLDRVHVLGGSVSPNLADNIGHFGWDMELSPGPMDITVIPTDPQTEYRRRFPDESAQYGKAFLSDLERIGWAGGSSGIVWNAIPGGDGLTDLFVYNASTSWQQGNASVASFGAGSNAGRFVLRRFVSLLGGVPFSVEMSDLVVPIEGESAAPSNAGGADRWDLYCLAMHDEPGSALHGKQYFELFQGSPGSGIPTYPIPSGFIRRLPLHILKMPAGSDVYTDAFDVRVWLNPPYPIRHGFTIPWGGFPVAGQSSQSSSAAFGQTVAFESVVNGVFPAFQHIPMNSVFDVHVWWSGLLDWDEGQENDAYLSIDAVFRGILPDGTLDPTGSLSAISTADSDWVFSAGPQFLVMDSADGVQRHAARCTAHWYGVIPSYYSEGSVVNPPGRFRRWTNFRCDLLFQNHALSRCRIRNQLCHIDIIPVET